MLIKSPRTSKNTDINNTIFSQENIDEEYWFIKET